MRSINNLYLCRQATVLHVVPPIVSDWLKKVDGETLRRLMSTVRSVQTSALSLGDFYVQLLIQTIPSIEVVQSMHIQLIFSSVVVYSDNGPRDVVRPHVERQAYVLGPVRSLKDNENMCQ